MSKELGLCMAGKLLSFRKNDDSGDLVICDVVAVEVADTDDGEIEFAFDVDKYRARFYVRVPIDRVLANIPTKYKRK